MKKTSRRPGREEIKAQQRKKNSNKSAYATNSMKRG